MGDPYPPTEVTILNGEFDNQDHWTTPHPWSIAGGLLIDNNILGVQANAFQINLPFVVGQLYNITFDLLNPAFVNPAAGVTIEVAGDISAPIRDAGTHTVSLKAADNTERLRINVADWALLDYCEIDNIFAHRPSTYPIEDLEIALPNNLMFEIHEAVATDFFARYSSLNGKSKILIAWDLP